MLSVSPAYIALFYLVPLGYGLFLRILPEYRNIKADSACQTISDANHKIGISSFYLALTGALEQINLLGGCMILFNCLLIYPFYLAKIFLNTTGSQQLSLFIRGILSCLTEISGGFFLWKNSIVTEKIREYIPLIFSLLTIGGLSCMVQTIFILKNSSLSIRKYFLHKLMQSIIAFLLLSQITKMLQ